MAEITYDPTPADQPEFSAEELDSLQVGEQLQQAEAQMLAGKYENAEQLEKAYLELQQKLGERNPNAEQAEPEGEQLQQEEEENQEVEFQILNSLFLMPRSGKRMVNCQMKHTRCLLR